MSLQYRVEVLSREHHSWYVWRIHQTDADRALAELTAPLLERGTPHRIWRRVGTEWEAVR